MIYFVLLEWRGCVFGRMEGCGKIEGMDDMVDVVVNSLISLVRRSFDELLGVRRFLFLVLFFFSDFDLLFDVLFRGIIFVLGVCDFYWIVDFFIKVWGCWCFVIEGCGFIIFEFKFVGIRRKEVLFFGIFVDFWWRFKFEEG